MQLVPLAVLAAITSPTAFAVVLVLLRRPRPVALLTGYLAGSLVTSVAVGAAIVAGFDAIDVFAPRRPAARPVFDILLGLLILASAAWLRSERSSEVRRRALPRQARRRAEKRERRGDRPSRSTRIAGSGSVGLVAALGMAMHLPGLLYLAALARIAEADMATTHVLLVLLAFNVVMLTPIEIPLLGCIAAPQATQTTVENIYAFLEARKGEGLLLASALAGGYLIVTGVLGLAA
jgi:hypothetical protein